MILNIKNWSEKFVSVFNPAVTNNCQSEQSLQVKKAWSRGLTFRNLQLLGGWTNPSEKMLVKLDHLLK